MADVRCCLGVGMAWLNSLDFGNYAVVHYIQHLFSISLCLVHGETSLTGFGAFCLTP